MKYGESTFDILYLLFAIISGIVILKKARNRTEKHMGLAALILGCGDAFHLVPRVLNYFVQADMTAALGIGKMVTSITMTVFYGLMYMIYLGYYHEKQNKTMAMTVWGLAAARIIICLFPQNGWLNNTNGLAWSVFRNVPFTALGVLILVLYYKKRNERPRFRWIWLYILLSFLFYIPVAVGTGVVPMLGMLMLPKTVCYVLMIIAFLKAVTKDPAV